MAGRRYHKQESGLQIDSATVLEFKIKMQKVWFDRFSIGQPGRFIIWSQNTARDDKCIKLGLSFSD